MTSFFNNALGSISGNPFSTPVGSKIEQATDETLATENWSLNIEICDIINESEDGPRDAVKAIRKRLNQNAGKKYAVVMYTLTILETCVKNCGKRFHILICNKDFIGELVKLIGPKNDPPTAVQEKVLNLIQSWADAFKNQSEMSGVVQVYQELLAKGIEFPATDLDALAPIHTPQRSVEPQETSVVGNITDETDALHQNFSGTLTAEQRAKLQSELDVVQSNMNVFGEMLSEIKPGCEQTDELELLQELHLTCQNMQERLVELINKLSNDELTAELLRINDNLNNLFLRFSRWEKNRNSSNEKQSASAVFSKAIPPTTNKSSNYGSNKSPLKSTDSLIDFDDDLSEKITKLITKDNETSNIIKNNNTAPNVDDFDMFAQSRKVTYENSKTNSSSYKDNLEPDQVFESINSAQDRSNLPEHDFDEIAHWLGHTTGGGEESVTSSEFDKFLEERASMAENLPSIDVEKQESLNYLNNKSKSIKPTKKNEKDNNPSLFS